MEADLLKDPLSRLSLELGDDGDLKLMRGDGDVVEFLESLFPQIQKPELIKLLDLFKNNLDDVVNHLILQDEGDQDDEIDTLVKLFPSSSMSQIQTAWIESNGDVDVAAQYLCEDVSDCKLQTTDHLPGDVDATIKEEDQSNNIYTLIEMFPDHSVEFLSSVLQDHGFDHGLSLLLNLDQACKGECIDTGFPCLLHSTETFNNSKSSVQVQKVVKNNINLQFILPPISRSNDTTNNIVYDENEIAKGSAYLRNMAQNARKSRNEAYQKASTTWKCKNLTGKGSASFYSLQGRSYHDDFSRWNEMAVEALLRENSRSECVLDLHGFTVQEAIGVLPRKIQEWRSAHQKKFKIIVGRGNRSLTGSKLGPAVKKWLTDNNIRHESEPGSFSLVLL